MSPSQRSKNAVAPLTAFEDIFTVPRPPKKAPPSAKYSAKSKKIVVPGEQSSDSPADRNISPPPTSGIPNIKKKRHISLREKERIYDVNLVTRDMPLYEPLLDEDLRDYFSSANIRKHLQKVGLITSDGKVIPKKKFKKQQVHLDHLQWQEKNIKNQEEMELDRDIEYAIRRQMEEEKNRISNQHIDLPTNNSPTKSYPEFLTSYPVTMWKTVLLYAEKPPSLQLTEKELLNKLKGMSRQKLKEYGLDPEKILPKIDLLQAKLRRKSGLRSSAPVHDDISELELESGSPVLKLFGMARRHYETNDIDGTKLVLHELVKLIGESPTSVSSKTKSTEELDAIDEIRQKAAVPLEATELLLVGYIQKLGGDVDKVIKQLEIKKLASIPTIQKLESASIVGADSQATLSAPLTLRPKSARPSRESDFPIGSEFSDFGGSEAGHEVSEQIMAHTAVQDVVLGQIGQIDAVLENEEEADFAVAQENCPEKGLEESNVRETGETVEIAIENDGHEYDSGEEEESKAVACEQSISEGALLADDSYLNDLICSQADLENSKSEINETIDSTGRPSSEHLVCGLDGDFSDESGDKCEEAPYSNTELEDYSPVDDSIVTTMMSDIALNDRNSQNSSSSDHNHQHRSSNAKQLCS
ncbi:hypothetical protein BDR26DRAFT_34366 [Obelidium mucronatum]|nr:hypothetical protein BDR26DRAFT_34366 [Obelidium mucronatum]